MKPQDKRTPREFTVTVDIEMRDGMVIAHRPRVIIPLGTEFTKEDFNYGIKVREVLESDLIPGPSGKDSYWPAQDTKTINEFSRILANKIENELRFGLSEQGSDSWENAKGISLEDQLASARLHIQALEIELEKTKEESEEWLRLNREWVGIAEDREFWRDAYGQSSSELLDVKKELNELQNFIKAKEEWFEKREKEWASERKQLGDRYREALDIPNFGKLNEPNQQPCVVDMSEIDTEGTNEY